MSVSAVIRIFLKHPEGDLTIIRLLYIMNKRLYSLAIFFLALSFAGGLFEGILLKLQGFSVMYEQSQAYWFLVMSIVRVIGHLFVLRYFFYRQWRFMSVIGTIAVIYYTFQFIFQYYMMINVARELNGVNTLIVMGSIAIGITMGAGLLFSETRKEQLLQVLGGLMIIFGLLLSAGIFGISTPRYQSLAMESIIWLTIFSNAFPLFYIAHFLRALKVNASNSVVSQRQEVIEMCLYPLSMVSLIALLVLGSQLGRESYWHRQWQERAAADTQKLPQPFELKVFVNKNGDSLQYLFLAPLDYDSTKNYPLVTCLHGGPTQVAGRLEVAELAPTLSEYEYRKTFPAFLFVPQAGPGVLWGGIPNVPSKEEIVLEAIRAIEEEYNIDPQRRYITGGSGGGYGTWHLIAKHPDMFAAAIPICGVGDPAFAQTVAHIPIWAFHGDVDRNVPVSGSRNMIEAIRKAGGNPKYNEFAGVGHNVFPKVNETPGVIQWLFAQKRSDEHVSDTN